jgi:hypothetical protein
MDTYLRAQPGCARFVHKALRPQWTDIINVELKNFI